MNSYYYTGVSLEEDAKMSIKSNTLSFRIDRDNVKKLRSEAETISHTMLTFKFKVDD